VVLGQLPGLRLAKRATLSRTLVLHMRDLKARMRHPIVLCPLLLLVIFFALALPTPVFAQEDSLSDLADLSIEELGQIEVIVVSGVSKRSETLTEAPGVVSVLKAEDIKQLGVNSVAEAVAFMPGVFMYDTYFSSFTQFAVRGNFGSEHYNNKILFLVNGHPVYNPVHGGFDVNSVPIQAVDRIELVRGPVSVMYGTNALTGVINIITKKGLAEDETAALTYQYGTWNTNEMRLELQHELQDVHFYLAGTLSEQDGYELKVDQQQDEFGEGLERSFYHDLQAYFLNVSYDNLELDIGHWHQKNPFKIGLIADSRVYGDEHRHDYWYADLRLTQPIRENISLNYTLRYDVWDFGYRVLGLDQVQPAEDAESDADISVDSQKYGAEVYANIQLGDKTDIVAGVMYDEYEAGEYLYPRQASHLGVAFSPWPDQQRTSDLALYCDLAHQLRDNIYLVGGLRFTDNSVTGNHFDYRLASIFALRDDLNLKLLYGTSYRSPNYIELYTESGSGILFGNPDLEPESLEGFDINLNYTPSERLTIDFTYFWNRTKDYIVLKRTDDAFETLSYFNSDGQEITGIEYEARVKPFDDFEVFVNASHLISAVDKDTGDDLDYVVENIFNFGWSWRPVDSLLISNANRYTGDWAKADSFFVSNLSAYYRPPVKALDLELFLKVNNIFDQDYDYAEFVRRSIDTIPGGPGRSITGGFTMRF